MYDDPPSTAAKYAARRGGADKKQKKKKKTKQQQQQQQQQQGLGEDDGDGFEGRAWSSHLRDWDIETVANALVFIRFGGPGQQGGPRDGAEGKTGGATESVDLRAFPVRRSWSTKDADSNAEAARAARWVWYDE